MHCCKYGLENVSLDCASRRPGSVHVPRENEREVSLTFLMPQDCFLQRSVTKIVPSTIDKFVSVIRFSFLSIFFIVSELLP